MCQGSFLGFWWPQSQKATSFQSPGRIGLNALFILESNDGKAKESKYSASLLEEMCIETK